MLDALRHGSFRWLFAAQSASSFGHFAFIVAIAALLVEGGADASSLGLVLAAQAAGLVVFALLGGVMSDRLPRRRMMVVADVTRTVAIAAILVVGNSPLVLVAALAFVVGIGESLFQPAYRGLLPRVLPDEKLQAGNALGSLSQQFSLFLGPAVAGVAIAAVGPRGGLAIAATAFTASWINLLAVREEIPRVSGEVRPSESLIGDAADGVRALRERPWIAWVIATATVHLLVAIAPYEILLPLLAEDEYGDVAIYGWLLAAFGVGAIVGAVTGARIRTVQPGTVAIVALVPFCLMLAGLALEVSLVLLIAVLVLAGFGEAIFDILWTTGLQRDVPDHLLSRVISLDYMGSLALLPVGLALTGPAVEAFGRSTVLFFGAGLALLTLLPLLLSDSIRRFSSAPAPAP